MAVRHGDNEIASVLNRLGYSTGKGNRWNQTRVATARKNHAIAGQKRALPDPDRVSLNEAARLCGVSHRSLERLAEAGLLKREQVAPRAPWQIRRADLRAEPVQSILKQLRKTGKLVLPGVARKHNRHCPLRINQMIMTGIMSEGSIAAVASSCGARPGNPAWLQGVWDPRLTPAETRRRRETESHRGLVGFVMPTVPTLAAG